MGIEFDINYSFIISRKGLVLTLSILPCPQGRISCSTPCRKMIECPYSTKTREVLGNPSPTPERFPETLKISLGSQEIVGDGGGWISQYLPRFAGSRIQYFRIITYIQVVAGSQLINNQPQGSTVVVVVVAVVPVISVIIYEIVAIVSIGCHGFSRLRHLDNGVIMTFS